MLSLSIFSLIRLLNVLNIGYSSIFFVVTSAFLVTFKKQKWQLVQKGLLQVQFVSADTMNMVCKKRAKKW